MKRSYFKQKPCPECGSIYHSKAYHKARKPIRLISYKRKVRNLLMREVWLEANPPDNNGYWQCYISKHSNCPKYLTLETLTLEHNLSKVRRPDLTYEISNIHPACDWDNQAKGSRSAKEYMGA